MTREIPLTQGLVAVVDDADAAAAMQHKWYANRDGNTFYAMRSVRRPDGTQTKLRLHTFLTGWGHVDHIKGDGLDNRRANLREATASQNGGNRRLGRDNTSGFKGVSWNTRDRTWQAAITIGGRGRNLGYHTTPEAAARAYDAAAREAHGEFAWLNFPGPDERGREIHDARLTVASMAVSATSSDAEAVEATREVLDMLGIGGAA